MEEFPTFTKVVTQFVQFLSDSRNCYWLRRTRNRDWRREYGTDCIVSNRAESTSSSEFSIHNNLVSHINHKVTSDLLVTLWFSLSTSNSALHPATCKFAGYLPHACPRSDDIGQSLVNLARLVSDWHASFLWSTKQSVVSSSGHRKSKRNMASWYNEKVI